MENYLNLEAKNYIRQVIVEPKTTNQKEKRYVEDGLI